MPDPTTAATTQWADYVFNRNGAPGVKREWWCHIASQHLVHRRARHRGRRGAAHLSAAASGAHEPAAARCPANGIDRTRPHRLHVRGPRATGLCRRHDLERAAGPRACTLLGRSFKYHRPRGMLSVANHDVNVLLQDGPRPTCAPTCSRCATGMHLTAVNTFGGARPRPRARARPAGAASCRWASTTRPSTSKRWFPRWERMFRRITGLGALDFTTPAHPHAPSATTSATCW